MLFIAGHRAGQTRPGKKILIIRSARAAFRSSAPPAPPQGQGPPAARDPSRHSPARLAGFTGPSPRRAGGGPRRQDRVSLHHAEHHRGADRRVAASPGLHRPAGDGSLGPLALAAALAAVAGAVVPFIVVHLIALAVITVVTVAGTAGIVQWMKRFSVAVMPERIQERRPVLRVYGRALPGRRPARALRCRSRG